MGEDGWTLEEVETEVQHGLRQQADAYRDGTAGGPGAVARWLRIMADKLDAVQPVACACGHSHGAHTDKGCFARRCSCREYVALASHPDRASTSPTTRTGEATETKQKERP